MSDQMNDLNIIMTMIYKFAIAVMVLLWISQPEKIGEWRAQMDIGYDSVWSEYIMDCDCTEPLE